MNQKRKVRQITLEFSPRVLARLDILNLTNDPEFHDNARIGGTRTAAMK